MQHGKLRELAQLCGICEKTVRKYLQFAKLKSYKREIRARSIRTKAIEMGGLADAEAAKMMDKYIII